MKIIMKKYIAIVIVIFAVLVNTSVQASSQKKSSRTCRSIAAAALGALVVMSGLEPTPPVVSTQYGVNPYGSTSYPVYYTSTQCMVPADFDAASGAVFDYSKNETSCTRSHYDQAQQYCGYYNLWEPDYIEAVLDGSVEEMGKAIDAHRKDAKEFQRG